LAGKWDYNLISRIQQANDIVDVISEHLNLEKKGKEMVPQAQYVCQSR
jgi:DNA primase